MGLHTPVDLDHLATTPLDPRVLDAMLPVLRGQHGNPGSPHQTGWAAAALVERARDQVAELVGAESREIIFTSGATESINLALKGVTDLYPDPGHLVTTVLEHSAVVQTIESLVSRGWRTTVVGCDETGVIAPEAVAAALTDETVLVSLTAVQNEIGTVQRWPEISAVCRERGIPLHLDGAQALGKVPLHATEDGVALLSMSAHKLYGPKGVGALFVRRRSPRMTLRRQIDGGEQERGLRSGTLNVAGIVGMGEACRLAGEEREQRVEHLRSLTAQLYAMIADRCPDVRLTGSSTRRLPGSLHLMFPGVRADRLIRAVPTLLLSAGPACGSGSHNASPVLTALGLDEQAAGSCVRICLGKDATLEEVNHAAECLLAAVAQLREA